MSMRTTASTRKPISVDSHPAVDILDIFRREDLRAQRESCTALMHEYFFWGNDLSDETWPGLDTSPPQAIWASVAPRRA